MESGAFQCRYRVKEILKHMIWTAAFVSWALLLAACSSGTNGYMDEVWPDDHTATLILRTALLDKTRAIDTPADNPVEYMYTLRIVILHADGSVEHNVYVDFGNTPQTECFRVLKVTRNETKKIYLIANEKSVSSELHGKLEALAAGDNTFRSIVDELHFVPDYKIPIPMSSVYDVPVNEESLVERQFYLVRAATKFTFRFTSKRKSEVSVDAIRISRVAALTYLMPHKQNMFLSFDDVSLYWIDWLKKVADESQQSPDDVTLADRRGWIQDYAIPLGQIQQEVTVHGPLIVPYMTGDQPGTSVFPVFYLPESKNLKTGENVYGVQEYTLMLDMSENGKKLPLYTQLFPNLKALFRNTHVLVDVMFTEKDDIKVQVVPYGEVTLKPEFGL